MLLHTCKNSTWGSFFAEWYDFVAVGDNVQHHKLINSRRVKCYISYHYHISVDLSKLPEDQTAGTQGKKGIYLLAMITEQLCSYIRTVKVTDDL